LEQEGVMSGNERFKDVIFAVEMYLPSSKSWHRLSNCNDLKCAESEVHDHELVDVQCFGRKLDYRIMKITIKKERVR
jgi:hypothetical protein